jgi:HAD superfamily phosphoserine phosphatase-like hydrolase
VTNYRSVVLDVDSTLSGIEGIDWLAERRAPGIAREIAALTSRAMEGTQPIESLYGRRLDLVRPTGEELKLLGQAYREHAAPGAREVVYRLQEAGVVVHLVSGGLREGILPFAEWLRIPEERVHAVRVHLSKDGSYQGWETRSPLATAAGKGAVVRDLSLNSPILAVGDGATDVSTKEAGATFAAFTGFVRRETVVDQADVVVATFHEISELVFA